MVRSNWLGVVLLALAESGLAAGQTPAPVPAAPEHTLTVRELDKPELKCRLLRTWSLADGSRAYLVQALATGEYLTVVETGGNPSGKTKVVPTNIYHWGDAQTPPADAPPVPNNAVLLGTAVPVPALKSAAPAAAAPAPLPAPVTSGTIWPPAYAASPVEIAKSPEPPRRPELPPTADAKPAPPPPQKVETKPAPPAPVLKPAPVVKTVEPNPPPTADAKPAPTPPQKIEAKPEPPTPVVKPAPVVKTAEPSPTPKVSDTKPGPAVPALPGTPPLPLVRQETPPALPPLADVKPPVPPPPVAETPEVKPAPKDTKVAGTPNAKPVAPLIVLNSAETTVKPITIKPPTPSAPAATGSASPPNTATKTADAPRAADWRSSWAHSEAVVRNTAPGALGPSDPLLNPDHYLRRPHEAGGSAPRPAPSTDMSARPASKDTAPPQPAPPPPAKVPTSAPTPLPPAPKSEPPAPPPLAPSKPVPPPVVKESRPTPPAAPAVPAPAVAALPTKSEPALPPLPALPSTPLPPLARESQPTTVIASVQPLPASPAAAPKLDPPAPPSPAAFKAPTPAPAESKPVTAAATTPPPAVVKTDTPPGTSLVPVAAESKPVAVTPLTSAPPVVPAPAVKSDPPAPPPAPPPVAPNITVTPLPMESKPAPTSDARPVPPGMRSVLAAADTPASPTNVASFKTPPAFSDDGPNAFTEPQEPSKEGAGTPPSMNDPRATLPMARPPMAYPPPVSPMRMDTGVPQSMGNAFTLGGTTRPIPADFGPQRVSANAFVDQGAGIPAVALPPAPNNAVPHAPQAAGIMDRGAVAARRTGETGPASGPGSTPQLLAILKDSVYPSQRGAAAEALSGRDWHAQPQVVDALVKAAQDDPAPGVRAECVHALARMGVNTAPVVSVCRKLKVDVDGRVRREAEEALTKLAGGRGDDPGVRQTSGTMPQEK